MVAHWLPHLRCLFVLRICVCVCVCVKGLVLNWNVVGDRLDLQAVLSGFAWCVSAVVTMSAILPELLFGFLRLLEFSAFRCSQAGRRHLGEWQHGWSHQREEQRCDLQPWSWLHDAAVRLCERELCGHCATRDVRHWQLQLQPEQRRDADDVESWHQQRRRYGCAGGVLVFVWFGVVGYCTVYMRIALGMWTPHGKWW